MIVARESTLMHTYARVSVGLLLTQSETRLLFNTCDKTLITILNFKISGGPSPSLYETLP